MNIAETGVGVTLPNLLLAGKDGEWIHLVSPSRELYGDFIHFLFLGKLIGNPGILRLAIALPFCGLIVIESFLGIFLVYASHGTGDIDGLLDIGIGWGRWRFATRKVALQAELRQVVLDIDLLGLQVDACHALDAISTSTDCDVSWVHGTADQDSVYTAFYRQINLSYIIIKGVVAICRV